MNLVFKCLILMLFMGSLNYIHSQTPSAYSPFSDYPGNATWKTQAFFLDDFAIYLKSHSEMIGFIVYFSDRKISKSALEIRARRAVTYLKQIHDISSNRLKICYGGRKETSKFVLQPIDTAKLHSPACEPTWMSCRSGVNCNTT